MPASGTLPQRGLSHEEPRCHLTLERAVGGPGELTQVLRHSPTEVIGQVRPGTTDLERRAGCKCMTRDFAETLTALDFVQPYLPVKPEVRARTPRDRSGAALWLRRSARRPESLGRTLGSCPFRQHGHSRGCPWAPNLRLEICARTSLPTERGSCRPTACADRIPSGPTPDAAGRDSRPGAGSARPQARRPAGRSPWPRRSGS